MSRRCSMRARVLLLTFFAAALCGCATNPIVLSPKVATVLEDAQLGLPIRKVSASVHWIPRFGRGLGVDVWTTRAAGDYARDLELELQGAAEVCAALARSELAAGRDFLEIRFYCEYGRLPPRRHEVVGVVVAVVDGPTLREAQDRALAPEEYRRRWAYFKGYKDQPDSKQLLKW